MKAYYYFQKMVEYFMWNNLTFDNDNIDTLWSELTDGDKQLMPFDVRSLNWRTYYSNMNANEFGMPKYTLDL